MKKFYNLSELLSKVELDPKLLGGPLRFLYWTLVRQKIAGKPEFEEALVKLSNDERFCKQNKARRREFCDRLTYSLIKGAPDADKGATELTWNRFMLGLVLMEITECTFSVKCKRKVIRRTLDREMIMTFNPHALIQNKKRSDEDSTTGLSARLPVFIEDPIEAMAKMNHLLGKMYWGFVGEYQIRTVANWDRFMDKYLQNEKNVAQIGKYRDDHYSNLKKALCNTENLTWLSFCRGLSALGIDNVEFKFNLTDAKGDTFEVEYAVDMGDLKFIQANGE